MDSRKCFVETIFDWIDCKRKALTRLQVRRAEQQGLHKETIGFPEKDELKLTWDANDVDLIELVTSLYEVNAFKSNRFELTRKDLLSAFESFLNINIKNAEQKLNRARDRKRDPAAFLEKLRTTFVNNSESNSIRNR